MEWESDSHIQAIGSYVLCSAASLVLSFDPIVLLTRVSIFMEEFQNSAHNKIKQINYYCCNCI